MSTKNEKRLIVLSNKRDRIMKRKAQAAREHKSTGALHAEHVDVTCKLLRAEHRANKQRVA